MNQSPFCPRILVIDENRDIHDDFRKILGHDQSQVVSFDAFDASLSDDTATVTHEQTLSFDLQFAQQGEEGFEMVKRAIEEDCPFSLAFVDKERSPGWDSLETISHILRVDPKIQVVISSAYSGYLWSDIVQRLGILDNLLIIKKPFDEVEILQLAHALTKKWSLQKENDASFAVLDHVIQERSSELEEATFHLKQEIEQRKHIEVELRLAHKLESVGRLAAGVAHEINTPTQFIGDNLCFLKDALADIFRLIQEFHVLLEALGKREDFSDLTRHVHQCMDDIQLPYLVEEIPRAVTDAFAGNSHVADIVGAMKEFSYPGTKIKEQTDLNALIRNVILVASNEWKHVAYLEAHLDPSLPAIPCLPQEFRQCILNLLVNAAHAISALHTGGGERGTIVVTTQLKDEMVEVTLSDSGVGIPEEIQDKIFDPFFTTKPVGKGTGQGLSIVHSIIVDKLRGRLSFQTAKEKGTTFVITLPVNAISEHLSVAMV
ncbi:MAG: ATP-binding protein [Nitrospirales bacterium]|nr:hypothetical protein [Nitrospira sp.]MDR4501495.1 ATP-binding protein [Nitrospirales bacterium]